MNINGKQIMAISIAVLSVLMVANAQLTDLFGPAVAKSIASASGLANLILGSVMAALTSTSQQFKDVSNTAGVEPIRINKDASPSIAALAVDPKVGNIGPADHEYEAVKAKAGA